MNSWLISAGLCKPSLPVSGNLTVHISSKDEGDAEVEGIESLFSDGDSKEDKILKFYDAYPELDHVEISEKLGISRTWARNVLVKHRRVEPKYIKHGGGRAIVQLSMDGEYIATFKTQVEAANITGSDYTAIGRCARGLVKSCRSFIFLFLSHYEKIKDNNDLESEIRRRQPKRKEKIDHTDSKKPKKVVQIALDGSYIKTFASIRQAAMSVGCNAPAIHEICYGTGKTRKGYRWMFLEDYERLKDQDLSVEYKEISSVYQYDRCGKLIAKHRSIHCAMKKTGISRYLINKSCDKGIVVNRSVFSRFLNDEQ